MSYFDTTEESEANVVSYTNKASNQDDVILGILNGSNTPMGASDIHEVIVLKSPNTPITSVRRSLNTLMKNMLIKKGDKQTGKHGRSEYTWQSNKCS